MEKLSDYIGPTILSMGLGTILSTLCATLKYVVYWEIASVHIEEAQIPWTSV